jgi:hypothetical protein
VELVDDRRFSDSIVGVNGAESAAVAAALAGMGVVF